MNQLEKARTIINSVDEQMAKLFVERMKAAEMVIDYKMKEGLPIFDAKREQEVIERNCARLEDENLREYYRDFLVALMDISKNYQADIKKGNEGRETL